ncbi:MAG: sensor histidine kinase [Anaerolineales bacterium]|nr:sensor histidine kinase [Anaerolineales bacterium]
MIGQAERIFAYWLGDVGSLLTALSELCTNLYEHSQDPSGCVLIQKNDWPSQGQVVVRMAVGDLGQGIRGSLSARHGPFGSEPIDYIRAAMDGRTARASGRGGLGLRRVEQIAQSKQGYLWLRSETAAMLSRGPGTQDMQANLALIPGTQVAVEIRAARP